jgi:HSP20 family protein
MWFTWNDFDRHLTSFNDLFRQLERTSRGPGAPAPRDEPGRHALFETPEYYVLNVDLPGVSPDALELEVHEETVTLAAKRETRVPEGYAVQRSERGGFAWKRSLTLPGRIDPDRVEARFDAGVLSVRIARAAEVQPRRIAIGHAS